MLEYLVKYHVEDLEYSHVMETEDDVVKEKLHFFKARDDIHAKEEAEKERNRIEREETINGHATIQDIYQIKKLAQI